MHQVLALHLLFVLILNVGLSVSAGYATLARATLRIHPTTTARSRRHAAVHDHRRGGVILHGIEVDVLVGLAPEEGFGCGR